MTVTITPELSAMFENSSGLNYATSYGYDSLGDLVSVVQGYCPNCQGHSFGYDALQRMTSARRKCGTGRTFNPRA